MLGSDHRYFIGQDNNGEHSGSTTKPEESARVHQDSKHRHPQAVGDRASEVAKGTIAADSQLWLVDPSASLVVGLLRSVPSLLS